MKNKREIVILFFLIQVLVILFTIVFLLSFEWGILGDYKRSNYVILVLMLLCGGVGLFALYLLKEFTIMIENEKNYELQTIKLNQMEETNDLLRSQKHDFLNSMQVIWGLLVIDSKDKAQDYIKKLSEALKYDKVELTEINKEDNPYLYTLLINKLHKCRDLDIDMDLNINDIEYFNAFNPIDIVNIFGNLIDNAIYEVKKQPKDLRKICIDIFNEDGILNIEVFNRGPKISEDIMKKMFIKGFTTKGNDGSGIGLHNVNEIVEKYKGSIEVTSDDDYGTNFIIRFKTE